MLHVMLMVMMFLLFVLPPSVFLASLRVVAVSSSFTMMPLRVTVVLAMRAWTRGLLLLSALHHFFSLHEL